MKPGRRNHSAPHWLACRRALLGVVIGLVSSVARAQEDPFPLPPKSWPGPLEDQSLVTFVRIDQLESRLQSGDSPWAWNAEGWVGGDWNKLWVKSEGEAMSGRAEAADIQALYARRIAPFWHVQAGVRSDIKPSPSRTSAVLAVQGLAPYWFEVEASAFLDNKGQLSSRLEVEYELLFTQRLILQPRVETNFAASADAERGVGRGFNDVSLGLRLRYEFRREIAPYIGVDWTQRLGDTADLAELRGQERRELSGVAGLRVWY